MGSSRDTECDDSTQFTESVFSLVSSECPTVHPSRGSFFPYVCCQGDLGQTFCFCDVGAYKDPMDTIPIGTVKACLDCETVIPGSTTLYPNSRYSHECVCPAGLLILEHFGRLALMLGFPQLVEKLLNLHGHCWWIILRIHYIQQGIDMSLYRDV